MILDLLFDRRSAENPSHPYWEGATDYGVKSDSGLDISYATALRYSPWWRGINLVSSDVAKLPRAIYKRAGDGKEKDRLHPAYKIVRRKVNQEMTSRVFVQTLNANAMACGNGYAFIIRDTNARPQELRWLDPLVTYPLRVNGVLGYTTMINNVWRTVPVNDMFHLRGMGFDGLSGYPVYKVAADSLGLGIGAEKFASVFFRNSARPSVVIELPGVMQPEAQKTFLEQWNRMHAGLENAHRAAILTMGGKVNAFAHNAKDSELLATREFSIREVANWLGVPPHKIGDRTRTAYASLEQENHSYLVEALDQWLCAWEDEWTDKLLTEAQKDSESHVVEFNRNAIVRASFTERMNGYNVGIQGGWLMPDEVRGKENMNPMPNGEGKKFYRPLNMEVVGGDGKEQANQAADLDFKRQVVKQLISDGTIGDVLFNLLNAKQLLSQVNVPVQAGAPEEPWLPVVADAGPLVSGDTIKDDEGDVVGGDIEESELPTVAVGAGVPGGPVGNTPAATQGEDQSPKNDEQDEARNESAAREVEHGQTIQLMVDMTDIAESREEEPVIIPQDTIEANREQIRTAFHGAISDVADRMTKRLAIATRKAAKKPAEFLAWLDDELPHHVPVITDALEPVVQAWRALGHEGPPTDELAATFVAKWAAALLDHSGRCTAENMSVYMDGAISELEKTLKQTLVTMIGE